MGAKEIYTEISEQVFNTLVEFGWDYTHIDGIFRQVVMERSNDLEWCRNVLTELNYPIENIKGSLYYATFNALHKLCYKEMGMVAMITMGLNIIEK